MIVEQFRSAMDLSANPVINLLTVMVIIWTAGVLFRKIRQPPVLGELLAGIIFGPSLLGIIRPDETIKVLSELGVFFLMFYAGLQTNPYDMKKAGKAALPVGIYGFLFPFLAGYVVCFYLFGMEQMVSIFIALGLSISAIAVNARVIDDLELHSSRVAPVIFGAAIVDDILSLTVFSTLLGVAAGNGLSAGTIAIVFLKVAAFFGVSIFIGIKLYPRFSSYFSSREAKGFTFALIVALIFGIMAEVSGLHVIIGAYMAGLFVREGIVNLELLQKIEDRFVAITYGFLGPIFFVSLSFHVTFDVFSTHLGLIIVLLAVAIVSKIVGAGLGALQGGMNATEAAVVSFAMNGRGAVELIIASIGLQAGIINDSIFSVLVVIAFVTTFFPPISLHVLLDRVGRKCLTPVEGGTAG
jgi:Kef-type K+ transport system membrane component KefB